MARGEDQWSKDGVPFTCLNSRAVHLEVATSLETECFINVFRGFINRRGPRKCIYSDNGSNFVVAERESQLPLKTGTRNKSKTNCSRGDASGCSNRQRLHTPVGSGKGWYAAPVWS